MTQQSSSPASTAFMLGALAGAAGALLLAPRSGQETRDKLKLAKDNWQDHALNATDKMSDTVKRGIQKASSVARERGDQAEDAVDKAKAKTKHHINNTNQAQPLDKMEDLV